MANVCDNSFYANSQNKKNLEYIKDFLTEHFDVYFEESDDQILEAEFGSRWTFPKELMEEMFQNLPDKLDIYLRCMSVELGCSYHELWENNGSGWISV